MRLTIKDIAKDLNVSHTTVSRVLNNTPNSRISEKTRKKILDYAQNANYVKNINAKRLSSGKSYMFLYAHTIFDVYSDYYHMKIVNDINSHLENTDYSVIINKTTLMQSYTSALNLIKSGKVDGLIVSLADLSLEKISPIVEICNSNEIPIICLVDSKENLQEKEGIAWVRWSYEKGAKKAVDLLIENGHTEIGFIGAINPFADYLFNPIISDLKKHNIEVKNENYLLIGMDEKTWVKKIEEFLLKKDRPTAIITRNDEIALILSTKALELGIRIPADLSIIGSNDCYITTFVQPPLTTMKIPTDNMAKTIVDYMFTLIDNYKANLPVTVFNNKLIIRKSVGIKK